MMELKSMGRIIASFFYEMENNPFMFETTNQIRDIRDIIYLPP